ncbi:MAG: hypothetical protein US76_01730, partial [Parcubacteria group bacterium GW2011_GWA2_38_13b]
MYNNTMNIIIRQKIFFISLGLIFTATISGTAFLYKQNNNIDIAYNQSPEIGDEIVVRFPRGFSEIKARKFFTIEPKIDGQLVWIEEYDELHFTPRYGFSPSIAYKVKIKQTMPWLAAIAPLAKNLEIKTVEVPTETSEIIYTPIIAVGKYIDVDLKNMVIILFENGEIVKKLPVAAKGNPKTSPTKEGIFNVLMKKEKVFSNIYHAWLPWSIKFSGPYFIHGWPYWPNGERLTSVYSGGCVRLYDKDAEYVYNWAEIGTPVIVYSDHQKISIYDSNNLQDGDLAREFSDHRVYIIKRVGEKLFKRHVLTEKMEEWYEHLRPFRKKIKIVHDGALDNYKISRLIRVSSAEQPENWNIYEIDEKAIKHKITCNDPNNCYESYQDYKRDPDEIYIATKKELDYYISGKNIELQRA